MFRKLVILGVAALFTAGIGGTAFAAGSKCDAGITKAAGKKVACRDGVYAKAQLKGVAPDGAKLQKCTDKFTKSCGKAASAGGCVAHGGATPCADTETAADTCSDTLSPSGAFLNVYSGF